MACPPGRGICRLISRGLRTMVWSFSGPSSYGTHNASSNIRRLKKQPTGSGLWMSPWRSRLSSRLSPLSLPSFVPLFFGRVAAAW